MLHHGARRVARLVVVETMFHGRRRSRTGLGLLAWPSPERERFAIRTLRDLAIRTHPLVAGPTHLLSEARRLRRAASPLWSTRLGGLHSVGVLGDRGRALRRRTNSASSSRRLPIGNRSQEHCPPARLRGIASSRESTARRESRSLRVDGVERRSPPNFFSIPRTRVAIPLKRITSPIWMGASVTWVHTTRGEVVAGLHRGERGGTHPLAARDVTDA